MEYDLLSHFEGSTSNNKSISATSNPNISSLDASAFYWSYGVLGRRQLFRPIFRAGYINAEDYYQKSYDRTTGVRTAIALGALMIFICCIVVYNRFGLFRKRRKLLVSLQGSKEQLEGIEWLRAMGLQESSLVYDPTCSLEDPPKRSPKLSSHHGSQRLFFVDERPSRFGSTSSVAIKAINTAVFHKHRVLRKSRSF